MITLIIIAITSMLVGSASTAVLLLRHINNLSTKLTIQAREERSEHYKRGWDTGLIYALHLSPNDQKLHLKIIKESRES